LLLVRQQQPSRERKKERTNIITTEEKSAKHGIKIRTWSETEEVQEKCVVKGNGGGGQGENGEYKMTAEIKNFEAME
jgi:hypothetical protein